MGQKETLLLDGDSQIDDGQTPAGMVSEWLAAMQVIAA